MKLLSNYCTVWWHFIDIYCSYYQIQLWWHLIRKLHWISVNVIVLSIACNSVKQFLKELHIIFAVRLFSLTMDSKNSVWWMFLFRLSVRLFKDLRQLKIFRVILNHGIMFTDSVQWLHCNACTKRMWNCIIPYNRYSNSI